jgi:hypothetical protein
MAELILGPLLRYVDETEATVRVETDQRCEVEVLGRRERTFRVDGHNYALICLRDLKPGASYEYEVRLDGERAWPPPDSEFPPSLLRTIDPNAPLRIAFGQGGRLRVGAARGTWPRALCRDITAARPLATRAGSDLRQPVRNARNRW